MHVYTKYSTINRDYDNNADGKYKPIVMIFYIYIYIIDKAFLNTYESFVDGLERCGDNILFP